MPRIPTTLVALAALLIAICGSPAFAQFEELELDPRERDAYEAAQRGRYVRARELASAVLRDKPESAIGALALGIALHEGDGNIPLALRQYQRARQLAEGALGIPADELQGLHRLTMFYELRALSDLGLYDELLVASARVRRLYEPQFHSVDVWPLMKLGRVDEAREAIARSLASGDRYEEVVARNGLCALDGFPECMEMLRVVQQHLMNPGLALRNAGVSAAMFGRFDEAERLLLESTAHPDEDTNPWRDLADLYLLEGRLGEAVDATRRMIEFGRQLPPRERQYSRAEELVASAKILLIAGHADRALVASARALAEPDRAAHWSGSAPELQAEGALLYRSIRRVLAELAAEQRATGSWYQAPLDVVRGAWHELRGWLAGRQVLPLLIAGGLRPKSDSADRNSPELSGPLWLVLDAIEVFGAGATLRLVDEVRAQPRPDASSVPEELFLAQLDAMETEARCLVGDRRGCLAAGDRAISGLPREDLLSRARLAARMAQASWQSGDGRRAATLYSEVMSADPGVLRRLGDPLPVSLGVAGSSPIARAARRALRTPRFTLDRSSLFTLSASSDSLCLVGPSGALLACGRDEARARSSGAAAPDAAGRIARALIAAAFAPRLDLSQQDLQSLDGTTVVQRGLELGSVEDLLSGDE